MKKKVKNAVSKIFLAISSSFFFFFFLFKDSFLRSEIIYICERYQTLITKNFTLVRTRLIKKLSVKISIVNSAIINYRITLGGYYF